MDAGTLRENDPVAAPETLTDDQVRFYKDEGYVLLRGILSTGEAAAMKAEIISILDIIGLGVTKLKQTHEYLAGSRLHALVNSPHLKGIASRLMEGASTLYLPFTAVKSASAHPGEVGGGEFHYHQDNQYTRFDAPGINLWFALSPMTEDNGCLRIVPRSHQSGTLESWSPDGDGHRAVTFEPEAFVTMLMEPGDCVAFSRLTIHGSGPNRTPEHRFAYAVQFHRDDVHYSTDGGTTWHSALAKPRWSVGPVERITPPQGKLDGH